MSQQDLIDLVDGAAIFSAGGGGDPEVGYNIVDRLVDKGFVVELVDPVEVPDDAVVVNFAYVGATTSIAYHSEAALKTFEILEEYTSQKAFAVIPVELGGFTWTTATLSGVHESKGSKFTFKAKNEILVAHKDGKLSAVAPDITTAVHPETGKCVTAEKPRKGDKLVMIGISAPEKWRTKKGLELWRDVL